MSTGNAAAVAGIHQIAEIPNENPFESSLVEATGITGVT